MFSKARNLITQTAPGLVKSVLTGSDDRSEAARKAAQTRKAQADRRSGAAKRAAQTRKAKADGRSAAAQRAARTRKQRDARVEAMVEATRRD